MNSASCRFPPICVYYSKYFLLFVPWFTKICHHFIKELQRTPSVESRKCQCNLVTWWMYVNNLTRKPLFFFSKKEKNVGAVWIIKIFFFSFLVLGAAHVVPLWFWKWNSEPPTWKAYALSPSHLLPLSSLSPLQSNLDAFELAMIYMANLDRLAAARVVTYLLGNGYSEGGDFVSLRNNDGCLVELIITTNLLSILFHLTWGSNSEGNDNCLQWGNSDLFWTKT